MILIAGPCAMESAKHAINSALFINDIALKYGLDYYFKSSFEKANRTSGESPIGVGIFEGASAFDQIKRRGIKTTTDVHESFQPGILAHCIDVFQIPAFLSRQTVLIRAAAETGRVINIKKGQFMSPEAAHQASLKAIDKAKEVWLTERGTFFGYNDIVVDFRNLVKMKKQNPSCKIIFDCTHSAGGPDMALHLAKAAVAIGVDGLFLETHENPSKAISDGNLMIPFNDLDEFLEEVL